MRQRTRFEDISGESTRGLAERLGPEQTCRMAVWLAVASGILLVDLVILLVVLRHIIRRLRRQLDEAKLYEAHLGATDQLIEFRLRQLGEQIEELKRAREDAPPEVEHTPKRRRIG